MTRKRKTKLYMCLLVEVYDDIVGRVPYKSEAKETGGHFVFITGCGIDCNGVRFWEVQDSYGITKGDQGLLG